MNKIDELKVRAKTIRDLNEKINGNVEAIGCKFTIGVNEYVEKLVQSIEFGIKELESNQPELDEDGIPYCKRKKSYPDWAKYEATDEDGAVFVYDDKVFPSERHGYFDGYFDEHFNGNFEYIKQVKPPKDWTKTLRRIRDKE